MPIYEYRCTDCQQLFEEWCRHIEDKDTQHTCPICKGKAERLISQTSFALKGGGWYVTEYGSHKGIKEDGAPSSCSGGACKEAEAGGKGGDAACACAAAKNEGPACKGGESCASAPASPPAS